MNSGRQVNRGFLLGWLTAALALQHVLGQDTLLQPGHALPGELAPGQSHAFQMKLAAGELWLVSVEQQGIDVTLQVDGPSGETLIAVDSPLDRRGRESLLLTLEAAGLYRLVVQAREAGAPPGGYRIRLEQLSQGSGPNRAQVAAQRAVTQAGVLYQEGSPESRRQAIARFREALGQWRTLGEEAEIARTLYCMAVLSRLINESSQALELGLEVLPLWQKLGESYWEAATLNEIGLSRWLLGNVEEARDSFQQSVALHRSIEEAYGEAAARANLCLMDFVQGRIQQGVDCSEEALPLLRQAQAPSLEGSAHTNLGRAYDVLGQPEQALSHYSQAFSLAQQAGSLRAQARALNNQAVLSSQMGEAQDSLSRYAQALSIFEKIEDRRWQARTLNNLGIEYETLGETSRALGYYRRALPLWREVGDQPGEAATLASLGMALSRLGDADEALALLSQALALRRKLGDRRSEGFVLHQLGAVRLKAGDAAASLDLFSQAIELLREAGSLPQESTALRHQGQAYAAQGDFEQARASLHKAAELARILRHRPSQAFALHELARIEQQAGDALSALNHVKAAVEIIEGLRTRIGSLDLRTSYSGMQHRAHRLLIDLLMEAGRIEEAFEAAQRARARTLAELLQETGVDIHKGVPSHLLDKRRSLLRRLSAWEARTLNAPSPDPQQADQLEEQRHALLAQLDLAEAEIRSRSPAYDELTRPQPLSLAQVQELLGPGNLLLSYALGEERSHLWAVSSSAIQSFELPTQTAIESAARRLHQRLSNFEVAERRDQAKEAVDLSRMLLGPAAGLLQGQRLIIEADGALHYIPFAALPLPGQGEDRIPVPLLEAHEIVYLPSVSALAVQRRALAGRSAAPRLLALLADPVFDAQDPRVQDARAPSGQAAAAPPAPPRLRGGPLQRLSATRQEAEAIAALAPSKKILLALGFEANRGRIGEEGLRPYQMVHFATHGLIDSQNPELSGLALSMVDPEGKPQAGFLGLHEIYNLNLGADLVVLSGCRTALGREIRGEGLIGLTRGFMYAGAPRVAASLWQVEDRATAALMTRFYQALWQEGAKPAAALRIAQLHVRQQRRWRDPFFWAAFVLQGEWE